MRNLLPVILFAGCASPGSSDVDCVTDGEGSLSWEAVAPGACADTVELSPILGPDDKLTDPRDLGFDAQDRLWVSNRSDDRTLIVSDPGTPEQGIIRLRDGYAEHFMEENAALSFDSRGQFGSCGETRNTYNDQAPANDFMGPALWTTDLDIFAVDNPIGLGSHLDMLHQSPLCVGIAWDYANVYWVFDGNDGRIVRYDFVTDHGPGYDDHADGIVYRLRQPRVERVRNAPGHLAFDPASMILYVADTGNNRVLWIDTRSGRKGDALFATNEPLADYAWWENADWGVLVEEIDQPGGIALDGDRLHVASWGTGVIHSYDLEGAEQRRLDTGAGPEGLYGIEVAPDGALWGIDNGAATVWRLDAF